LIYRTLLYYILSHDITEQLRTIRPH